MVNPVMAQLGDGRHLYVTLEDESDSFRPLGVYRADEIPDPKTEAGRRAQPAGPSGEKISSDSSPGRSAL